MPKCLKGASCLWLWRQSLSNPHAALRLEQLMLLKGACSLGMQAFTCHLETGSGAPGSANVLALSSHCRIWITHPPSPIGKGYKEFFFGYDAENKIAEPLGQYIQYSTWNMPSSKV